MTGDEVKDRLQKEPDFIYLPRHNFSVEKLLKRYPDGVPDHVIAQGLMLTEDEVAELYQSIVKKLRRGMGIRR